MFAVQRFYHASPALSTPHRRSLGHPHPPHLPLSYGDFRGLENEFSYTIKKISAYGTKDISSKMRALSSHLAQRLTRLSGLVPSGTLVAMVGRCVLLLPTMPLMRAARVCTCRA